VANLVTDRTIALLQLEEFLPYRLAILSSVVAESVAPIHQGLGLGWSEWMLLMMLGEAGSMTATAFGARIRMHKTKVSRVVAALAERQLILRSAKQTDMRQALLQLSPAGKVLYNQCVALAVDHRRRLEHAVPPEDWAALDRSLDRLVEKSRQLLSDPFKIGSVARDRR
jgi:DNA-binding MarR family transcriptional regulator